MTRAVEYLLRGLQDPSEEVRKKAFLEICRLPRSWEYLPLLIETVVREARTNRESGVWAMVDALVESFGASIIPVLESELLLEDTGFDRKLVDIKILSRIMRPYSTQVLVSVLRTSRDTKVRIAAVDALAEQYRRAQECLSW